MTIIMYNTIFTNNSLIRQKLTKYIHTDAHTKYKYILTDLHTKYIHTDLHTKYSHTKYSHTDLHTLL